MPEPVCSVCGGHPQLLHAGPGITIDRTGGGSGLNSEKRIYTTVARDRIVEEGDPEAAFLVTGAGGEVPAEYAELYSAYQKPPKADATPAESASAAAESADAAAGSADAAADSAAEAKAVEKPPENKARARADAK